MEFYTEAVAPGVSQVIRIDNTRYAPTEIGEGDGWRKLHIFDNASIGVVVAVNDRIRFAGEDGKRISEYLAHWPMFAHRHNPRAPTRALVINFGDGAIARQLARHSSLRSIDVVEDHPGLFEEVTSRVPEIHVGDSSKKIVYHAENPWKFLESRHVVGKSVPYDIIIWNDLGDQPKDALSAIHSSLAMRGILVRALGSYSFAPNRCVTATEESRKRFKKSAMVAMSLAVASGQSGIYLALVMANASMLPRDPSAYQVDWLDELSYYDKHKHPGIVRPYRRVAEPLGLSMM